MVLIIAQLSRVLTTTVPSPGNRTALRPHPTGFRGERRWGNSVFTLIENLSAALFPDLSVSRFFLSHSAVLPGCLGNCSFQTKNAKLGVSSQRPAARHCTFNASPAGRPHEATGPRPTLDPHLTEPWAPFDPDPPPLLLLWDLWVPISPPPRFLPACKLINTGTPGLTHDPFSLCT